MNNITKQVLSKFTQTMILSFIGMLLGYFFIPQALSFACSILAIVILVVAMGVQWFSDKNIINMPVVHLITFLLGVSISVSIKFYISTIGATLILAAFGVTALLFAGLALYACKSKKDFSFLGGFLFIALFALIVLGIVNIFVQSSLMGLGLAFVGVLIFSGYVLYDVSSLKRISEEEIPMVVLGLYLDFINMFLEILKIISYFVSDND